MTGPVLRYTLVADGPGDRALLPILNWLLRRLEGARQCPFRPEFFDPRTLDDPPSHLSAKITRALQLFPCDVLFVHSDAEGGAQQERVREIEGALPRSPGLHVCIVPVRMTEAWLLIDQRAIRSAAGNPNGTHPLAMPSITAIESIPDPKQQLRRLLLDATAFRGRRKSQFERELNWRMQRVAELIEDFRLLRELPAFQEFENATRGAVERWAREAVSGGGSNGGSLLADAT
jgi:hypothetical protein